MINQEKLHKETAEKIEHKSTTADEKKEHEAAKTEHVADKKEHKASSAPADHKLPDKVISSAKSEKAQSAAEIGTEAKSKAASASTQKDGKDGKPMFDFEGEDEDDAALDELEAMTISSALMQKHW